jgi:hypothetical protein
MERSTAYRFNDPSPLPGFNRAAQPQLSRIETEKIVGGP